MLRPCVGPSSQILRFARTCVFVITCAAPVVVTPAAAGRQSVADAAKRTREQKKQEPASGKVWTNDNVPMNGSGVSVVGEAPVAATTDSGEKTGDAPASDGSKEPAAAKAMSAEEIAKKRADLQAQLEEARHDQERIEKELDLAKRDLDLQTQQAFSNPMAASTGTGQAQIQPYQDLLASKQDQMEKQKAKIAELQKQIDELRQQATTSGSQQ